VRCNAHYAAAKCWEDQHFRDRWRTLLSVDELVGDLIAALTKADVIDNTYIFYSSGESACRHSAGRLPVSFALPPTRSEWLTDCALTVSFAYVLCVRACTDHGYKQGQWRVGTSKEHPYDTDIRVPLLARGPGIKPGSVFNYPSGNVDLTPTLLTIAGGAAYVPEFMDGKSMTAFLTPTLEPDSEVQNAMQCPQLSSRHFLSMKHSNLPRQALDKRIARR
jgi:arylsulfatase A-like enzyme